MNITTGFFYIYKEVVMHISKDDKHEIIIGIALALGGAILIALWKRYILIRCPSCGSHCTFVIPRLQWHAPSDALREHHHLVCLTCLYFRPGDRNADEGQEEPVWIEASVVDLDEERKRREGSTE